jgi:hypothetical protein
LPRPKGRGFRRAPKNVGFLSGAAARDADSFVSVLRGTMVLPTTKGKTMSNKVTISHNGADYVVRYLGKVGGTYRAVIHEAHDTSRGYAYADAPSADALTLDAIGKKIDARLALEA